MKYIFLLILSSYSFAQEIYKEKINGTEYSIDLVLIKGGEFKMGSSRTEPGHLGDEGPVHSVRLDSFWMGKYEITWDLYNLFVSREIDDNQVIKLKTKQKINKARRRKHRKQGIQRRPGELSGDAHIGPLQ